MNNEGLNGRARAGLGLVLVAVAAMSWGGWALVIRPSGLSGAQCGFIAQAMNLLPLFFVFRRAPFRDKRATLGIVAVGVADALNVALFFSAYNAGSTVLAVLTHYLAPLLVALVAPFILREPRSRRALVSAPLMLLGLVLVIGMPEQGGSAFRTAALGAGSAVFYAIVVLGSKAAARSFTSLQIVSFRAPIALPVLLALYGSSAVPTELGPNVWRVTGAALVLGLGGGLLFNAGLRRIPAAPAGALTYLEPLTAAAIGFAYWGEPVTALALLGAAIVLGLGAWTALEPAGEAPAALVPPLASAPAQSV